MAKKKSSKKAKKSSSNPKKSILKKAKNSAEEHPKQEKNLRAADIADSYKALEHPFLNVRKKRHFTIILGMWSLIIAVIASVMLALIETPYLAVVLVAVGFAVGFLNWEHEEPVKFIVATTGIIVVSSAVLITGFSRIELVAPVVAAFLKSASYNIISVVAPAVMLISIKALKELAE